MAIDNCVQATLDVLDSKHWEPGWESSLLEDLKVPLRFLRTFYMCGKKWGRSDRCQSFLFRIEQTVNQHEQEFQSTDGHHLQKTVSELLVCIQQSFLREMDDLYRTLLLGPSQTGPFSSSSSFSSQTIQFEGKEGVEVQESEFLVDVMDSLLHNLQDLRHYNDFDTDSTAPVEDLEGYVRFLKNLVLFALSLGLEGHRQVKDLLSFVQDLVLNAARLIFLSWYNQYRRMLYIVHQLIEKIQPVKSHVFFIYVGVLEEASESSYHQNLGSLKIRLGDFVDSLLFLLSQLLFFGSSYEDIFNHQMQTLFQDLTFLRTFLREHISEGMPDLFGAVICEAGILICHLFTEENEGGLVERFSNLERKFKLIKVMPASGYPRVSKITGIRFLLEKMKSIFAPAVGSTSSLKTDAVPGSFPEFEKELSSTTISTHVSMDDSNLPSFSYKEPSKSLHRGEDEILQLPNLKSFSFSDLKKATRNFRSDNLLGEGGFGKVFKGWINENSFVASKPGTGVAVAVKCLKSESLQGHREWLAEVKYLGQFSHPHLVKLIGYCLEGEHRLLVYEFMPRGSLEKHLFRRSNIQPLSWSLRLKVAIGAAKAVAFLHSAERNVIHRNLKTSNILLDSDYNAKLSGFGIARAGPNGDESDVSTVIKGTVGYMAPEYALTGLLTARCDVYGFGVVLVEMLCGRRGREIVVQSGESSLVEWAKPYFTNKKELFHILDDSLQGQYSPKAAYKVAKLAFRCISTDPRSRPTMDEVVKKLEDIQELQQQWSKNKNSKDDESQMMPWSRNVVPPGAHPKPSDRDLFGSTENMEQE